MYVLMRFMTAKQVINFLRSVSICVLQLSIGSNWIPSEYYILYGFETLSINFKVDLTALMFHNQTI